MGHTSILTVGWIDLEYQTGQTLYLYTLTYFFVIQCKACDKVVHNIHFTYKFIQTLQ